MKRPFSIYLLAMIVAVGVALLASEISPAAVNWLLLLIVVGMVISRWREIGPLFGLIQNVAGEGADR